MRPQLYDRDYAEIACPETPATFFLQPVEDRRGYADSRDIGFTQTGMLNVKASLLTSPSPADLVGQALAKYLARCGRLAKSSGEAKYVLTPLLVVLQVTEKTGIVSEKMSVELRYEITVVEASSEKKVGRPTVNMNGGASGVDTTDEAQRLVEEVLRRSLASFGYEVGKFR